MRTYTQNFGSGVNFILVLLIIFGALLLDVTNSKQEIQEQTIPTATEYPIVKGGDFID